MTDLDLLLDAMVEAMDETQQEFGPQTAWHDLARAALGAVRQEVPVALFIARLREQAFRAAVELTTQDVRTQCGDRIAQLVEDSFRAHFAQVEKVDQRVSAGVRDARAEVKAAVEEWFSDVSLDDLFAVKGWDE